MTGRNPPRSASADLVGSAAAILGGSLAALAASLAIRVVIARTLSPAELGALLLGISIVSFAGVSASLGLRAAGARRVSALLAGGDAAGAAGAARTSLAAGALSGAVVTAVAAAAALVPPLAGGKLPDGLLMALTPAVFGLAAGTAVWGVSQGFGDTRGRALWRDSLGGLLRLAGVGLAALAGGGLLALALGWALGSLCGETLFTLYGRRRGWFTAATGDGARPAGRDRALLASLPPFAGNTSIHQVVRWLDMLLVGLLAPLSVVALYGLAQSVYRVLGMVQGAAAHRFLPLASAAVARGDGAALAAAYRQTRDLTFRFLWLPLAPCLLCPRQVTVLAFGAEYAAAGPALQVLAGALAASAVCGYTEDLLYARDRPGAVFVRVSGVSVLTAVMLLVLVPRWGALGAAVATAAALVAGTLFDLAMLGAGLTRAVLGRSLASPVLVSLPALVAAAVATALALPPLATVALVGAAAAPPALARLLDLLPRTAAG